MGVGLHHLLGSSPEEDVVDFLSIYRPVHGFANLWVGQRGRFVELRPTTDEVSTEESNQAYRWCGTRD